MVIVSPEDFEFPSYEKYFNSYPFKLSTWQKHAIKNIVDGNHPLVIAPTGNGKTLPAEFAISYFHSIGKKVIYTSPIKALSNQKCWDLKSKYPNITFGLLTGDIKDNPNADCIICTTEILRNNCYNSTHQNKMLDFNINLKEEVGAVIFDEVHYINDKDRGNVWEECFMLLPQNVQFIMLSATIANPERFANWIESIDKPLIVEEKKVAICSTDRRIVPSEHYFWFSAPSNLISKKINDSKILSLVNKLNQKLTPFKQRDSYNDSAYHNICKLKYLLSCEHIFGKQSYVLNQLLNHLKKNKLLPAICFVYSRKNVEKFANMCNINLFEDSKKTQNVEKECQSILRKLPNYKEYLLLPEYKNIISCLEKGIGIHHAGILPVFKEMIELLFDKGYIKLLFATETFAVGINFPAPTVIFTDVMKFDGSGKRMLHPHEFTQQSGRAGRRGFDEKGYVIHLSNLFELPDLSEYKIMMNNKPQTLISKFKISYPLVLNIYHENKSNAVDFASQSMIRLDIEAEQKYIKDEIENNKHAISIATSEITNSKTPSDITSRALELESELPYLKNKRKIKAQRELTQLFADYKNLKHDLENKKKVTSLQIKDNELTKQLSYCTDHIKYNIDCVNEILLDKKFITKNDNCIELTKKGLLATKIKETHSLVFADILIETEYFKEFSALQLISFLTCFTNVHVNEEYKIFEPHSSDYQIYQLLEKTKFLLDHYYNTEVRSEIYTGLEYGIIYDLVDLMQEWWLASNESECVNFLQKMTRDKGIFIGEFVKAILKINSIAQEIQCIAEFLENMALLEKTKQIYENTFKFIATNQSLYI